MKHAEWLIGTTVALLVTGCEMLHHAVPVSQFRESGGTPRSRPIDHSAFSIPTSDYLVRPDTGERQVLGQLLHELQLVRHLIDDAYARRDERARVRVDYARLADEFDRIITGLRRTLTVTETAPRDRLDITGDYQLYE